MEYQKESIRKYYNDLFRKHIHSSLSRSYINIEDKLKSLLGEYYTYQRRLITKDNLKDFTDKWECIIEQINRMRQYTSPEEIINILTTMRFFITTDIKLFVSGVIDRYEIERRSRQLDVMILANEKLYSSNHI